jgi:transcriptional antiterminator RfaH
MDKKRRFLAGEQVKLVRGIFSSCHALVEGMTDKDRVVVLLDMLGRSVRLSVHENAIAAE